MNWKRFLIANGIIKKCPNCGGKIIGYWDGVAFEMWDMKVCSRCAWQLNSGLKYLSFVAPQGVLFVYDEERV